VCSVGAGRLEGKVALITGGARGIGAATARRFVDEGANVVVTDVLDADGTRLATSLGDAGAYAHLDVRDESEWERAVESTTARFGGLHVLVNNAGITRFAGVTDMTLDDYLDVIGVNQVGCFLGMRTAPGAMVDGGSIVNISSMLGFVGGPAQIAYTATKFAVRGMTKVAAGELGPRGIRVNSIHPGGIDTELARIGLGDDPDAMLAGLPAGRAGRPEEVAAVACYLASDDASYSTGSEFVVDGGWLAVANLP